MKSTVVDLRSDTVTKPTPEMRQAMAIAEVGDDVYREDPTVLKLEEYVANLLGKEAGLFVPSGTMGNLISMMVHCWERGREVFVGDQTHIYLYEQGGAAQLAGIQLRSLKNNEDGTFDLEELKNRVGVNPNMHECITSLICLENTNNRCSGAAVPTEFVRKVCEFAKEKKIAVHMDGARLLNASIALGQSPSSLVEGCDSVSLCLSKGIGAPVGTVIAGTRKFIERALRCRKVLGGAMRQVGVLAAAAIVALESATQRLTKDHSRAQVLARAINEMDSPLVSVNSNHVQSNMVVLNFKSSHFTAPMFVEKMNEVTDFEKEYLGEEIIVKTMVWSPVKVRCVLHSDISDEDLETAIKKMKHVINSMLIY